MSLKYIRLFSSGLSHVTEQGCPPQVNGRFGRNPLRVSSPEAGNFAALAVEVAAQFAGNIEHAGAAAVVALIEHVVGGPEIVRAAFRHFILRHFPRMLDVGNIHDVADGAHRDAVAVIEFENRGEHFVADKQIILVAEHAVRARPASRLRKARNG